MSDQTNPDADAAHLIRSLTEPGLITDRDNRILAVNQGLTDWLGHHSADLQGLFWTHYGPSSIRPAPVQRSGVPASTENDTEFNSRVVVQSRQGTSHPCRAVCHPVCCNGQLFLIQTLHVPSPFSRGLDLIRIFLDSSAPLSLPEFLRAMTRQLLAASGVDLVFAAIEESPSKRRFQIEAIATHSADPSATSCVISRYDTTTFAHTITVTPDGLHTAYPEFDLTNDSTPTMRGYYGYEFDLQPASPLDRPLKGHIGLLSQTPLPYSLQLHDSLIALGKTFQQQHKAQLTSIRHTDGEAPSIDAVIECDTTGCVTVFNDVAENIFQYRREEVIGLKLGDIIIPERYRDAHRAGLEKYVKERRGHILNTTIEIQAMRKNGKEFPVELTVVPYESDGDIHFRGTLRDITERWHNEEQLRREQRRFQSLFDNSPVAIWEQDLSSLMQWMQQLRIDGITDFEQYLEDHPEQIEQALMRIRILNVNSAAVKQNRADGREHLIDTFHTLCTKTTPDSIRHQLLALWNGDTIIEFESTSTRLDGERLDLICSLVIPVLDNKPEYNRSIFTGTDVTERRRSERAVERIRNHQTLDKIGRLAGGIAHDFNNLLTVIVGCADLLREKLKADPDNEAFANDIIEASLRAKWLTDQLLTFGKRRRNTPVVVDANSSVRTMTEMLTRVVGEQVDLICSTPDEQLCVRLGDGQIEQVLMNLVMNAKDAFTTDPRVYITTSKIELTADDQRDFDAESGSYAYCQVKDQGCGMTAEETEHAFEPFFTTKRRDEGTGLGLATVYGIVKGGKGDIRITSRKGSGTTVEFILPIVNEAVSEERSQVRSPVASRENKQTVILVVEDEDEVRKTVYNILTGAGYSVLTANGGHKALRVCNSFQGDIDLLLTDVMMPGMNGREVAEQIRVSRKEIKILFMTGYDDSIVDSVMDVTTLHDIIEKPFTARTLCKSVQRVLTDKHE